MPSWFPPHNIKHIHLLLTDFHPLRLRLWLSLAHMRKSTPPPPDVQGQERRNSTERRRSSVGSVSADGGDGNPLTGPITRDEVFNLLEEKADRKDLEKRMAAIVTRYCRMVVRAVLFGILVVPRTRSIGCTRNVYFLFFGVV